METKKHYCIQFWDKEMEDWEHFISGWRPQNEQKSLELLEYCRGVRPDLKLRLIEVIQIITVIGDENV